MITQILLGLKDSVFLPDQRVLIFHADDMGMAEEANEATIYLLENGYIQSASAMAPCPSYEDAISGQLITLSLTLEFILLLQANGEPIAGDLFPILRMFPDWWMVTDTCGGVCRRLS
jgi:hypothetical protein